MSFFLILFIALSDIRFLIFLMVVLSLILALGFLVFMVFEKRNYIFNIINNVKMKLKYFIKHVIFPQYKVECINGKYYPLYRYHDSGPRWKNFVDKDEKDVMFTDIITAKYFIDNQRVKKQEKKRTYYIW